MGKSRAEQLSNAIGPIAGSVIAADVSAFFGLVAQVGMTAAITTFSATASPFVVLGFVSIFGASVLSSRKGAARKARNLEHHFKKIHERTYEIEALINEFADDSEVFAKLSKLEQGELSECTIERFKEEVKPGGELDLMIRDMLRRAGLVTKSDIAAISSYVDKGADRVVAHLDAIESRLSSTNDLPLRLNLLPFMQPGDYVNPLYYGARLVQMVGRHGEINELKEFLSSPPPKGGQLSWWFWSGGGGAGKSRLALELCLEVSDEWEAGFLSLHEAAQIDWRQWTPQFPTLVVIDYALARISMDSSSEFNTGVMIANIAKRARQIVHPVRVLALDRETEGPRFKKVLEVGSTAEEGQLIRDSMYRRPYALQSLQQNDDLRLIVADISGALGRTLPEAKIDQIVRAGASEPRSRRPLYASLAAIMAVRDPEGDVPRQEDLVASYLDYEKMLWAKREPNEGQITLHANLLSLSTLIGERSLRDKMFERSVFKDPDTEGLFPRRGSYDYELFAHMAGVSPEAARESLRRLEPDPIGEAFLLGRLRSLSAPMSGQLIEMAWVHNPDESEQYSSNVLSNLPSKESFDEILSFDTNDNEGNPILSRQRAWARLATAALRAIRAGAEASIADGLVERFREIAAESTDDEIIDLYVKFHVGIAHSDLTEGGTELLGVFDELSEYPNLSPGSIVQLALARSEVLIGFRQFDEATLVIENALPAAGDDPELLGALSGARVRVERLSALGAHSNEQHPDLRSTIEQDAAFSGRMGFDTLGTTLDIDEVYVELQVIVNRYTENERVVDAIGYLEDVCSRGAHVVLTGGPGAGKSTVLQLLYRRLAYQGTALPLFVRLRDLNELTASLFALVQFTGQHQDRERMLTDAERAALAGQAVFVLDGWDEIPARALAAAEQLLKKSRMVYSDCPFIVSSRQGSALPPSPLAAWPVAEVQHLTQAQAKELLGRRFYASSRENVTITGDAMPFSSDPDELIRYFDIRGIQNQLLENPLTASFVSDVWQSSRRLPSDIDELMNAVVQLRLTEWDIARGVERGPSLDLGTLHDLLAAIAWGSVNSGVIGFTAADVEVWIQEFQPRDENHQIDVHQLLRQFEATSGFLFMLEGDRFQFTHRMIAESLARRHSDRLGA